MESVEGEGRREDEGEHEGCAQPVDGDGGRGVEGRGRVGHGGVGEPLSATPVSSALHAPDEAPHEHTSQLTMMFSKINCMRPNHRRLYVR